MIEISKCLFTHNPRYIEGRKFVPKGVMVHSTGANNPFLKRYVQPDDGVLGRNTEENDWNRADQPLCVHAFIGKDRSGAVRCYQVLPWDTRTYHCGTGPKGSGNSTHISFEICEDKLLDAQYFAEIYDAASSLCAYLCIRYSLPAESVICHSEGHALGIASGHADVMHWFPRFGKNMDMFRAEVAQKMEDERMTQEKFGELMDGYLAALAEKEPADWSRQAREWAEAHGIVKGGDGGRKMYGRFATREEIAQMLYNALGSGK